MSRYLQFKEAFNSKPEFVVAGKILAESERIPDEGDYPIVFDRSFAIRVQPDEMTDPDALMCLTWIDQYSDLFCDIISNECEILDQPNSLRSEWIWKHGVISMQVGRTELHGRDGPPAKTVSLLGILFNVP